MPLTPTPPGDSLQMELQNPGTIFPHTLCSYLVT